MVNADRPATPDCPVTLRAHAESRGDVSLVSLVVENPTASPRRVRVANRLDGPIRPPRREGVPEAGWDDGGFEGVVAAGATSPLGYASPASPTEPPAELVWTERAGETECERSETFASESTPEGVLRSLGTARPPADAVPAVSPDSTTDSDLPEPVASWLAGVEQRATAGPGGDRQPTADDRAALAAVARRIEALRGSESSNPVPAAARRSP